MVTVIIPNYNHARYLPQRIESVLNQKYSNLEIILMDDCSPDNSREIISYYADKDSRISVFLNDQNGGNTFRQWNKGIALARGKYIWIAESDDYADPNFLTVLVKIMEENQAIGLAYCDSITVDEDGNHLYNMKNFFNENFKSDKWLSDFVMVGSDYVKIHMPFGNTIPNASAVLLRKSVVDRTPSANVAMRLAGDWMYWSSVLSSSEIAYTARSLNYFRTHTNNVRSKTEKNGILLEEISEVMVYMKSLYPNEAYDDNAADQFLYNWELYYKKGYIPLVKNFIIAKNIKSVLGTAKLTKKLLRFIYNKFL